jgi:hypothetical protein
MLHLLLISIYLLIVYDHVFLNVHLSCRLYDSHVHI